MNREQMIASIFEETMKTLNKYKEKMDINKDRADQYLLEKLLDDVMTINSFIIDNINCDNELFTDMLEESLVNMFFKFSIVIVYLEYIENFKMCAELRNTLLTIKPGTEHLINDNIVMIKSEMMSIYGNLIK